MIRPIVPEAMRAYDRFKQIMIDTTLDDQTIMLANGERARIIMIDRLNKKSEEFAETPLLPGA